MSECNDSSACFVRLNTMSELKRGLHYDREYICGPAAEARKPCQKMLNDEYSFNRTEGCRRAEPSSIWCRLSSHKADPTNCCLNKPTRNNVGSLTYYTCDERYRPNQAGCDALYGSICNRDATNPLNNPYCATWARSYPDQAAAVLRRYCNNKSSLGNPLCRDYCMRTGECDSTVIDYCRGVAVGSDELCACLESESISPKCLDARCQNLGYMTQSMRAVDNCPMYMDCSQNITIDGATNALERNQMIQRCVHNDGRMPDQPTNADGSDSPRAGGDNSRQDEPTGAIDDTPRAGGDNSRQDDPLMPTTRLDPLPDDKPGQKTALIVLVVMIVILISIGCIGLIWYATSSNKSTGNAKTVE
jgi:hypothetical protein